MVEQDPSDGASPTESTTAGEIAHAYEFPVSVALAHVAKVLRRKSWEAAIALGVTPAQGELLARLFTSRRPVRLGELANWAQLSAATVSESINFMEAKGYVCRVTDPEDRRAVMVVLTRSGRSFGKETAKWAGFLDTAASELSPSDQRGLAQGLTALIAVLVAMDG
ncbi:MarR family winged helix-turn-helix transcriptional regulator [Pandoraea pneumonica]|uniref:MarR family winged helix-turn-helix transcriptional regulator n=1 Tax=Pandoraea pneumonica TaxID=2508299 RepID=UPI003CF81261